MKNPLPLNPRWLATLLSLSVLSLSFSAVAAPNPLPKAPPIQIAQTPTDTSEEPTPEESEDAAQSEVEEPELPDSELVFPEDDPNFIPDPNQRPLEDDFNRMLPTQNPWFWRLELRNQTEYNSNVDQVAGGQGSLANRTMLTGILRYSFPSNTQILLRSQGFWFNYFNLTGRNQLLGIPLSVTVSQWFDDKLNIYGGWVPVLSTSLGRDPNVQRFDNDFMLGGTWYHFFENKHILYAGYQLDYLAAQSNDFSYLGNLLFAGYRHSLADNLFFFADARLQPRGYTATAELLDELRFGGALALQWHVLRPWFIIEARGDYNQVLNMTDAQRSAGIFSFGINLITAIQSES
ncbi:MAG: hypothetical protein AB7I41_05365 [Candidatus Sericytochromatia bacterium]